MTELSQNAIDQLKEISIDTINESDEYIWRYAAFFENGFGISIICGMGTYGGNRDLFEIAVLLGDKTHFELCYDTPITNDVIGYLTEAEVLEYAHKIKDLKEPLYVLKRDENTAC